MAEEASSSLAELEDLLRLAREHVVELEAAVVAQREHEQRLRKLTAADTESRATTSHLHSRSQHASMKDVNDTARLNMSRSNSDDPFVKACRAKNLTQNDVAKKLKIPRSLLSMYRAGVRRIPQDRAEAIEALTDWKATPKNWPGGILAAD